MNAAYRVPEPRPRRWRAPRVDPVRSLTGIIDALAVIGDLHRSGKALGAFDCAQFCAGLGGLRGAAFAGDTLDELEDLEAIRSAMIEVEIRLRQGPPDLLREVIADGLAQAAADFETADDLRERVFACVRWGLERAMVRLRRALDSGCSPDLRLDVRTDGRDMFAVHAYRNRIVRSHAARTIEIRNRLGALVEQRERVAHALAVIDDLAEDRPRRARTTPRVLIEQPAP